MPLAVQLEVLAGSSAAVDAFVTRRRSFFNARILTVRGNWPAVRWAYCCDRAEDAIVRELWCCACVRPLCHAVRSTVPVLTSGTPWHQ